MTSMEDRVPVRREGWILLPAKITARMVENNVRHCTSSSPSESTYHSLIPMKEQPEYEEPHSVKSGSPDLCVASF